MTAGEAVAALVNACREAGVDPELIFQHYAERDIEAYRDALEAGHIQPRDLHLWMRSTARTIAENRCLCEPCIKRRNER